jgi:formate dehydrogenase maturation protein FdhE
MKVLFYCPKCGEGGEAELLQGSIYAETDDKVALLECASCETRWRIVLWEVEEAK